jgi:hypothetical protein
LSPATPASDQQEARLVPDGHARKLHDQQALRRSFGRSHSSWLVALLLPYRRRTSQALDPRLPALPFRQGQLASVHILVTKSMVLNEGCGLPNHGPRPTGLPRWQAGNGPKDVDGTGGARQAEHRLTG